MVHLEFLNKRNELRDSCPSLQTFPFATYLQTDSIFDKISLTNER